MIALRLLVLVAGMTTMATEMSAARLLAPFFGTSVIVWANIIGLMLVYLSIGYWWGGRIADAHPHRKGLTLITLGAAASIAVVPFIAEPILSLAVGGIDQLSLGSVVGSFLGTLLLFVVPITLLGMVPPYAVRLALGSVETAGHVSGGLYALSTVGSILGTFGSVLVLIPWVGTRRTMLVFALALGLLSLWGLGRRVWAVATVALIAGAILVPVGAVKASETGEVIFEKESLYQFVQVVEQDGGRRVLQLNEGWAVHSVYEPDTVMTGGIWDHFLVLPGWVRTEGEYPRDGEGLRMLIIGNAAGSAARAYRQMHPGVHIDGVEIDPLVTEVGYEYFDMRGDNLVVHTADGRPFLQSSSERWDIIHIDAYRQPYIPFHLSTREFFQEVEDHLNPGGVLAINVGSTPDDERIQEAIGGTMRDVFPSVFRYQAEEFNELIVATTYELGVEEARGQLATSPAFDDVEVRGLASRMQSGLSAVAPGEVDVLTDDHAPVEWMTDRMIVEYAAEGAG